MPDPSTGPGVHLDLTEPHRHLVGVTLLVEPRGARMDVRLPAWTPGSYLIRDYVKAVEDVTACQGGVPLAVVRAGTAAWILHPSGADPVRIRFRVLATELSVRTCHLDGDHGFLALAGVVPLVEGERWRPHRLTLDLPGNWQAFLPLARQPDGSWTARDYDELIDSPLEAGNHPSHDFQVAGVPHRWVGWGGDLPARDPGWLADVEKVCLACCRLMGVTGPACREPYLFVLHLLEQGYGGLEHDRASVLQYGRRALVQPGGRRKLLQLVAHEYLHQWNVRRLRPAELFPIDYETPVLVPTLWFAEGVTSYYDQLLPHAAGLGEEAEVLEDLGADLSRYLLTPGRRVQSLRASSLEAWVKLYRQDAHSPDNQISYYLKGAVLALVLDLHLRRSGSALSQVLQALWHSHGRVGRGYREEELLCAFTDQAPDLSTLLPNWLEGTHDPELDPYLADVGLRLVAERSSGRSAGWQAEESSAGSLKLKRVERGGPAETAGLQVGDELLALDGQRVRQSEDLSAALAPGADTGSLEVLFCRDGRIRTTTMRPAGPAVERWRLVPDPGAPAAAVGRRTRWLSLLP